MVGNGSKKVSVRIRQSLLINMKEIWQPKYGGKGRSRWVDEAVTEYLTNPDLFYQQANFIDVTDFYAFQFVSDIREQGELTKSEGSLDFVVSERVSSKTKFDDPIANEKFTLTAPTILLLSEAQENISLIRSKIKIPDPRGCIIRTSIEYAIVNADTSQATLNI